MLLDGEPVLLLCSNNYLGLADHPRVREAAAEAAMRWGVGAGASRLVSGTMTIHRRLEERLAAFEGSEACVLFGSGYLANLGVIGALAGRGDTIFSDELNHASIIDGCRLSRAEVVVYRHRDLEHLELAACSATRGAATRSGRVIVTDSVFSMDGDVAPLAEIVELAARLRRARCRRRGARDRQPRPGRPRRGRRGRASRARSTWSSARSARRSAPTAPTRAPSAEIVRYLINTARSLIFSTAPAAARASPARWPRSSCSSEQPAPRRSGCARTRACCAAALAARGLPGAATATCRSSR